MRLLCTVGPCFRGNAYKVELNMTVKLLYSKNSGFSYTKKLQYKDLRYKGHFNIMLRTGFYDIDRYHCFWSSSVYDLFSLSCSRDSSLVTLHILFLDCLRSLTHTYTPFQSHCSKLSSYLEKRLYKSIRPSSSIHLRFHLSCRYTFFLLNKLYHWLSTSILRQAWT